MKKFKFKKFKFILIGLVICLGLQVALTAHKEHELIYEKLRIFSQAISFIQTYYIKEVSPEQIIHGAIEGAVKILDDPYSKFIPQKMYKTLREETEGWFGGVGIQIGIQEGQLTVIAPIEDTPAYKAGIKGQDKIIKINGEDTTGITLMEAVYKLRGPVGSTVTITIRREGVDKDLEFTITRAEIKIQSVKFDLIEENIGYLKITTFNQQTVNTLQEVLKKLEQKNKIKGLVLDLRNNAGGLLDVAIEVAEKFLPPGKIIVTTKGRLPETMATFTANPSYYCKLPLLVLVNKNTASGAEIVAGAIKDNKRGIIVGERTFGKASVQKILELYDKTALKLTTSLYYTPSGRSIEKVGIEPDVEIKQPEQKDKPLILPEGKIYDLEHDKQLKHAINILKATLTLLDAK